MSIFVHELRQGLDSFKMNPLTLQQTKNIGIMTNELAKAVIGYFQKKQAEGSQLSVEESTIFNMAQNAVEYYPVVCMSKNDLEDKGFDTSNVTDNEMEYMAKKMGDNLVEQLYWETLVFLAERIDIPRKENDDDE